MKRVTELPGIELPLLSLKLTVTITEESPFAGALPLMRINDAVSLIAAYPLEINKNFIALANMQKITFVFIF